MNCCYTIWSDIIIPLIAALIGGGLTLIGVIWTIKAEKKKDKKAYLERIRPFFVLPAKLSMATTPICPPMFRHLHSRTSIAH